MKKEELVFLLPYGGLLVVGLLLIFGKYEMLLKQYEIVGFLTFFIIAGGFALAIGANNLTWKYTIPLAFASIGFGIYYNNVVQIVPKTIFSNVFLIVILAIAFILYIWIAVEEK